MQNVKLKLNAPKPVGFKSGRENETGRKEGYKGQSEDTTQPCLTRKGQGTACAHAHVCGGF